MSDQEIIDQQLGSKKYEQFDPSTVDQTWIKKYQLLTPEEKELRKDDGIFLPVLLSMYEKDDLRQYSINHLVDISGLVQSGLDMVRQLRKSGNTGWEAFAAPMYRLHARVLDEIQSRAIAENVEKIVASAQGESKEDLREQIQQLIDTNNQWQSQFREIEQERKQLQEHINNKVAEREAFKERWAIWKSFLEKESVSTILGAFLLLIIVVCLIVTTFTHVTTPQILNDGFLVLLGYFFGQTAANAIKKDKGE